MTARAVASVRADPMPQVVSANRLSDGIVVFLATDGRWVEGLRDAALFDATSIEQGLAKATADVKGNVVIEVVAFDVVEEGGRRRPAHIRDAIRAAGPTVRRDTGKQAAGL